MIDKIFVDQIGWIHHENGEIKEFEENGEMAKVKWYGQNNKVFNGKYVIMIEYGK